MCRDNTDDVCEGKDIANVETWVWVGCQVIHLHRWLRRHEITTCTLTKMERHPDVESVYSHLNMVFDGGQLRKRFNKKVPYKLKELFDELVKRKILFVQAGKLHWPSWTHQWLSSGWNGDISPLLPGPPASPTRSSRQAAPRPISISSDEDEDDVVNVVTSRQTPGISHGVPPTTPAASNRASPTTHATLRRSTREMTRDMSIQPPSDPTPRGTRHYPPRDTTPPIAHQLSSAPTYERVAHRPTPLTEAALRKKDRGRNCSMYARQMTPPTSPPSIRSYNGSARGASIDPIRLYDDHRQSPIASSLTNNRGSSTSSIRGTPRPHTRLFTTETPEPRHYEAPSRQSHDYHTSLSPPRAPYTQDTPYSPVNAHLSDVESIVSSSVDEEWESLLDDYEPTYFEGGSPCWVITFRQSQRWKNSPAPFGAAMKTVEAFGLTPSRTYAPSPQSSSAQGTRARY